MKNEWANKWIMHWINSKPQHRPRGTRGSVQISAPGAKIVFQYSTQVLYLMVNFFWKGKMSDPDILYIAKPYKLDLVDLFSGAIRTQKWTLYLKTPPHYKLKHLYSTLPVQIPTPTRRGSHSLTLGTNDRSPTGEC